MIKVLLAILSLFFWLSIFSIAGRIRDFEQETGLQVVPVLRPEIAERLFPTPTAPEPVVAQVGRFWLRMRVVDEGLHIREAPSVRSTITGRFPVGTVFVTDPSTETIADGYTWHEHDLGWSALAPENGNWLNSHVRIVQPPDSTTLPGYGNLFHAVPVNLDRIDWVQYFGDTVFARQFGHHHNYDGYAQGMHGGLDFGVSEEDSGLPRAVFAGLYGTVVERREDEIWLGAADYVIKYQHLEDTPNLRPGDPNRA